MARENTETPTKIADWSDLPVELVLKISEILKQDHFDIVHARSVCSLWRSKFRFPAYLSRKTYTLPSFPENKGFSIVEKLPLFFFRVNTLPIVAVSPCEVFLGRLGQDDWEDHSKLVPSFPLQCSVKVETPGSDPSLINARDCQIIPLGDHYRMSRFCWDFFGYIGISFLSLNKEGEEEKFVVILNYINGLLVLTSTEMKWKPLKNVPTYSCTNLVTFRGQFYATFLDGGVVVINPYSLVVTPQMRTLGTENHLVPCGDDELYLVQKINPIYSDFRVSRLDVETGIWVEVKDLGERVLFINTRFGNVSCSAKEIPHGCGLTGNSILFITDDANVAYFYKCGTRSHAGGWISSRENRVTILPSSDVLALRVV